MNELLVALPSGKQIHLNSKKTIMGRSPKSDIIISDPHVSNMHCSITKKGKSYYIEDLKSTNGTFINGDQIKIETKLKNNDTISLGKKTVAYQFRSQVISLELLTQIIIRPKILIPSGIGLFLIFSLLLYFLVFINIGKIDIQKGIRRVQEIHGTNVIPDDPELILLLNETIEAEKNDVSYETTQYKKDEYEQIVEDILTKSNLSRDYSFIIWAETHFNPLAYNRYSGARGMWQLMPATARYYGLTVNKSIDERLDPIKSTHGAALYLKDIISIFGQDSFLLVLAAYNAGDSKIVYALKQIEDPHKDRTFWYLYKNDLIPAETKSYVLKILSLIILSYSY